MSRAVVIGGGITGTLVAMELRRSGREVVLLEGQHVGAGSSSRTAAGIRQQFSTRETVLGMRYSVDFYRRWSEIVGGGGDPIHQNGYLFLIDDPTRWEGAARRVEDQKRWGLDDVEALSPDEVAARFPFVDSDAICGGTWCPSDGFLRPEVVYNDAAAAFRVQGGELRQNAEVTGSELLGGRLVAVETTKGRVEGDVFVDCTNAWTRRVAPLLGGTPLPVAALKRYLWFFERGGPMSSAELLAMPLTIVPGGAYCRPENSASLMVGWKHDAEDVSASFTYEDQDSVESGFSHKTGIDARPFDAWMALADVLPPVGEFAGIAATTAGFYGTTPDHNPYLDIDPQVPNLVRLVGFSGHGAMFGPFSARVAVELCGGKHPGSIEVLGESVSLEAFRIGRPSGDAEAMVI